MTVVASCTNVETERGAIARKTAELGSARRTRASAATWSVLLSMSAARASSLVCSNPVEQFVREAAALGDKARSSRTLAIYPRWLPAG